MILTFPEWTPDLAKIANQGLVTCKNVLPHGQSYKKFPGPIVASTNALDKYCQGAASFFSAGFTPFNIAGTKDKLYSLASGAFSDVSKVGGYTTTADNNWYFTQFNEYILTTNNSATVQKFLMGTDTIFSDLGGTPPVSKFITTVLNNGFVVLGNISSHPYRVQWSGFQNMADWSNSAATQSGFNDLNSQNGQVSGLVGGEYLIAFQERAINRGTYVGSPVVFQWDELERGKGTLVPGSIIKFGNMVAYLGLDGFYVFDGQSSQNIGSNKIDKFFYNDFSTNNASGMYGVNLFDAQTLLWIYPGSGNVNGIANKYLAFNYAPNAGERWSYGEITLENVFISRSSALNFTQLGAIYSTFSAIPYSFNSSFFTGGALVFSGFNSSHQMVNFTSTALSATIETSDTQITDGARTFITLMKPLVEGNGSASITIGERQTISDAVTYGAAITQDTNGFCSCRSNNRYHRFQINTTGDFDEIIGIELVEYSGNSIR